VSSSRERNTLERLTGLRLPRISINGNKQECENVQCSAHGFWQKFARTRNGGVFLQGRWYCCLNCFEQAIAQVFAGLIRLADQPIARAHRIPIGLLLLGRGTIDEEQLKRALQAQRETGSGRLGRWLVRLGLASAQEVSTALAAQWGCAVFPLEGDQRYLEVSGMLPLALLQASRMMPVRYVNESQQLFLAFSDDIDHSAIYAIERLLGSHTKPCVVSDAAMDQAMDRIRLVERRSEMVFETICDAPQIARTIREYAVKLNAEELMMARPRNFLWVRLKAEAGPWDLLFRLPSGRGPQPQLPE
jgi:type II secretion system (T2SS) protein E